MNDELQTTWKEAVMYTEGTIPEFTLKGWEKQKTSFMIADFQAKNRTRNFQNTTQKC